MSKTSKPVTENIKNKYGELYDDSISVQTVRNHLDRADELELVKKLKTGKNTNLYDFKDPYDEELFQEVMENSESIEV